MSREQRPLLQDIADACLKVSEWTESLEFEEFVQQGMAYSAVLRELSVIGEAIKQVDAELRGRRPELPWREWAGLRDIVVHHYFGLQDETLWRVVREDVPVLSLAVNELISSLP